MVVKTIKVLLHSHNLGVAGHFQLSLTCSTLDFLNPVFGDKGHSSSTLTKPLLEKKMDFFIPEIDS